MDSIRRDAIKIQRSNLSFSYYKDTAWTIFSDLAVDLTTVFPNDLKKWGCGRKTRILMLFSKRLLPLYFLLLLKVFIHLQETNTL